MPFEWIHGLHFADRDAHYIDNILTELLRHNLIASGELGCPISGALTQYRIVSEYLPHDELGRAGFEKT